MTVTTRRIPWGRLGTELFVIVAGILIALGVNSWWASRSDRHLVQTYLAALEDDLRTDSLFYAETALPRMVRKRAALDAIGPVVREQEPVPSDTLGFLDEVALGGLFGIPGGIPLAETTAMDELVSTGALALFESAELRASLTLYYSSSQSIADRASALMPNYPLYVHGASPAELRDERTEADVRAWGLERAVGRYVSPEFETVLNQEYNYMLYIERQMVDLADDANVMLLRVRCARRERGACASFEASSARHP